VNQDDRQIKLPEFLVCPDAIAIDIDGTLLDSQSRLSERNSAAILSCITQRIPVVIATSRAARSVRRLLGKDITNACSLITQNGAMGIGRPPLSGQAREKIPRRLAADLITAVLEMEPEIRITLELDGELFGTNQPRDPITLWEVNSATPDMQLTIEEAMKYEPGKFALGGLNRDITHVADMILQRYGRSLTVVGEAGRTFLNVTMKTASKSATLRRLLQSQNISLQNVVAIGDDLPDFDMLSACGIPIAMANAVPEIKAVCRYHTASNNDNGVAVVLEKILDRTERNME